MDNRKIRAVLNAATLDPLKQREEMIFNKIYADHGAEKFSEDKVPSKFTANNNLPLFSSHSRSAKTAEETRSLYPVNALLPGLANGAYWKKNPLI